MTQQPQRRPRRHHEGHDQREQHRRRCTHRNRPHVRTHQATHEGHRQNGGNHGEGREDGGIADFVHRFDRYIGQRTTFARWQAEVPHHVFDHDNRIVHQDADGEDQREERDPVQRVAEDVEDEQGQRQGDGNGDQHDTRLAPAQRQRDQQRDRQRSQEEMLQQFVGLVLGGLTVVAGDRDIQVGRQKVSAQLGDFLFRCFADDRGVGAFALGQRDGHRGILATRRGLWSAGSVGIQNVIFRLGRAIDDLCWPRRAGRPACPATHRPPPASNLPRCQGSVRLRPETPGCPGQSFRMSCARWPAPVARSQRRRSCRKPPAVASRVPPAPAGAGRR